MSNYSLFFSPQHRFCLFKDFFITRNECDIFHTFRKSRGFGFCFTFTSDFKEIHCGSKDGYN